MTREEARAAGAIKFQGRPCKHGHNGERYVNSRNCVECDAVRVQRAKDNHNQKKTSSISRREARARAARTNHLSWLASHGLAERPAEESRMREARAIDPQSPEGQAIVGQLYARYPHLTLPASA
jgi:hypothetical protein